MPRQRGNAWQADAIIRGRRVRRQFKTKREAELWESSPQLKPVATCEEVFRRCFEMKWRNSKDERNAYRIVEELISYHKEAVSDWDTTKVRQFITDQRKRNLSNKTINRKLAKLSRCLTFAYKEGNLLVMPAVEFLAEGPGRLRFLTDREEHELFSSLTPEHKQFAIFLVETGARVGEALRLRWRDCNSSVTFWDTKNRESRTVPLTGRASKAMDYAADRWGRGDKPVWHTNYDAFHADWQQAKALAGLENDSEVVPHILRHTCASRLSQLGLDLNRIKTWMGHKDLKTTLKYAHLHDNALKDVAHALDTRAKSVTESAATGVTNVLLSG